MRKISEVRVVDAKTGGVINNIELSDFEEVGKPRTYEQCLEMARARARELADRWQSNAPQYVSNGVRIIEV